MKTVLITGASRGIGRATAEKFLAEGWFVIGTSTRGEIDISPLNFSFVKLDLSDRQSIKRAAADIRKLPKNIDVLVNNAGISEEDFGDTELTMDKLRKTLEVNIVGIADFTEQLLASGNHFKHIINISSMSGSLTAENGGFLPAYKISKAALNMYTHILSGRLAPQGTIVSSIDPGWVKTDMGGDEAPREASDAADDIYTLAISKVESGQFWLNGKKRSW
jgi:NAD(P)-dependent dehydrogenase (short-subunit alcohol dehydrogenase family)